MADLNEVLEACDAWQSRDNRFKEDEFEQSRITAATLAEWILANRTQLERFELEQAARWAVNAEQWQTVVVAQRSKEPPEFVTVTTSQPRGEPNGVIVGANWKPEAGR